MSFDPHYLLAYLPALLRGLLLTLEVSAVALILALVIGLVGGTLRFLRIPVASQCIAAYVEFIRNTPLLVQIFFITFGLPAIGLRVSLFWSGVLALSVWAGAFHVESIRGGCTGVARGLREAGGALGLHRWQVVHLVVLPLALRSCLPSLLNTSISLVKNTALPAGHRPDRAHLRRYRPHLRRFPHARDVQRAARDLCHPGPCDVVRGRTVRGGARPAVPHVTLLWDNRHILLQGLWATVLISLATLLISLVIGVLAGVALCMLRTPLLRLPLRAAVELLRAIPQVVNVYFVFFIAPALGVSLSAFTSAIVSLSLWGGANATEIVRGGLLSLPRHQYRSARALGLAEWEVYLFVLLPQALRIVLPSLAGLLALLIQSTTIAALVGVPEFLHMGRELVERTTMMEGVDPSFLVYGLVLVVYFLLCTPVTWLSRWLERYLAQQGLRRTVSGAPAPDVVSVAALS
jgi:polar amino acid transport system permease protein